MTLMLIHPILLQDCNVEEVSDEEDPPPKSSKDKKANGPDSGKAKSLVFKITSKVPYKTVLKGTVFWLKIITIFFRAFFLLRMCCFMLQYPPWMSIYLAAHSAVVLKAESMTDKSEWINKIRSVIQPSKGGKGASTEGGFPLRQSLSDGSLVS